MRVYFVQKLGRLAAAIALPLIAAYAASPAFRTLYSFQGGQDGAIPSGITFGTTGALYGVTTEGGIEPCSTGLNGCGTVFGLAPPKNAGQPWTEKILYRFTGQGGDAANPFAGPSLSSNGVLFGTTYWGGANSLGTVFQLAPPVKEGSAWNEAVLYSFSDGGAPPAASLLISSTGALFGTTLSDGANGNGTAFELMQPTTGGAWIETTLGNISTAASSGLTASGNGALYGTSLYSGPVCQSFASGCGTVFQFTPPSAAGGSWTQTTVYAFLGLPTDGSEPSGNLVIASDGTLYGTTWSGGASNLGTVYSLAPPSSPGGNWTETVLYSFTRKNGDGAGPNAGVVIGKNGALYGTTQFGGKDLFSGTIFSLTPPAATGGPWTIAILHSFTGQNGDGANPSGGLAIGPNGAIYGVTQYGGTADAGTVFELIP